MIHAIYVARARPNLIKIKPVLDGRESLGAKTTFVHTGQHDDEAMSGVFLANSGCASPTVWRGLGHLCRTDGPSDRVSDANVFSLALPLSPSDKPQRPCA